MPKRRTGWIFLVLLGVFMPVASFADLTVEGKIPLFANDGETGKLAASHELLAVVPHLARWYY